MNVLQLLTSVQPAALLAALQRRYPDHQHPPEEGLRRFLDAFRAEVPVRSRMTCRVYQPYMEMREEDPEDDLGSRNMEWTTVEGTESVITDEDADRVNQETGGFTTYKVGDTVRWSISFTPWGEWSAMPVEDACVPPLSTEDLAAEVVWEITWHSWDQLTTEAFVDSLRDRVEEIQRELK